MQYEVQFIAAFKNSVSKKVTYDFIMRINWNNTLKVVVSKHKHVNKNGII